MIQTFHFLILRLKSIGAIYLGCWSIYKLSPLTCVFCANQTPTFFNL
jgi:hypothetical protein